MPSYFTGSRFCFAAGVVIILLHLSSNATAQLRITIKKPRITIGKPKISIPSPVTIVKNVGTVVAVATKDVVAATSVAVNQTGTVLGNVNTTLAVAGQDVTREIGVGVHNVGIAVGQGGHDIGSEVGRIPAHVVDAGSALTSYVESYGTSAVETVADAERRIRQGKIADALFHVALAPLKAQEEAAFRATQESGWVNSVGAVAAAAYGGPEGSAAYAAWQTYRITNGNTELAIRAGLIAGLTKAAMGTMESPAGAVPVSTVDASTMLKRSLLAGTIGGLSIAASGGDDAAIRNSILMGGGMMLVQDGYRNYVGLGFGTQGATEPPYCMSPNDPDCIELRKAFTYDKETKAWKFDPSKLNGKKSFVGIQTKVGYPVEVGAYPPPAAAEWGSDRSVVMQSVARIPGFNAMAIFHDKWAVDWGMGTTTTVATILPAVALTYIGTGAQLFTDIPEQVASTEPTKKTTMLGDASGGSILSVTPSTATSSQPLPVLTPKVKPSSGTLFEALQDFKKGLPASGMKPTLPPVFQALKNYQASLAAQTDSIVAKHKGIEKLADGIVKPSPGWAWTTPTDSTKFDVHRIEGLEIQSDGNIRPAPGWEWLQPADPLSMQVQRIKGIEFSPNGELQPANGWEWVDLNDPKNLKVLRIKP